MWTARRATKEDVEYLAPRLRDADVRELLLSTGETPLETLTLALTEESLGVWVGIYEGNPEVIYGVAYATKDKQTGHPWLLGTDKFVKNSRGFMKKCRLWVQGFSLNVPYLYNYVHVENEVHVRWLKWCGFSFGDIDHTYGVGKAPFYYFELRRDT